MPNRDHYTPTPIRDLKVRKTGEHWTLILTRDLHHSPDKVWAALTDPAQLREWAPFEVDGSLDRAGTTVKLTWIGTPTPIDTKVTRADAFKVLEYGDIRFELEPLGAGTRLTIRHSIDRRYISWGTAGWHVSFDVLDSLLAGSPIGRMTGADAMKSMGWQQLVAAYTKLIKELPNE